MEREDIAKTLQTLVKYNNGFWKSEKQRDFLIKSANVYGDLHMEPEDNLKFFGFQSHLSAIYIESEMRFADYGRRSYRRIAWMFTFDQHGVVGKYRIRFNYDDSRGASSPAPEKTEIEWTRPADVVSTMKVAEPVATKSLSQHVGQIGSKVKAVLTIKKMIALSGQIGYARTYSDLMLMEDEVGNQFVWNSSSAYKFEELKEGNTVTLVGTIKAHKDYKGIPQTVLTRCKVQ